MWKGALVAMLLATGCLPPSYTVSRGELQRLAGLPPEHRGDRVRVVQEVLATDLAPAPPISPDAPIVIVGADVEIVPRGGRVHTEAPHGASGGGGHGGSAKSNGQAEAIAVIAAAVAAIVVVATIETARFDGFARLHPMYPLHLFGPDGATAVAPLAQLDPRLATWADHAIVRADEGPWYPLDRAPLYRTGWTYGVYGGVSTLHSADGRKLVGPATVIQLGLFNTESFGFTLSAMLGWRNDDVGETLLETRYTAEIHVLPIRFGPIAAGVFAGGGGASRFERLERGGNVSSLVVAGGGELHYAIDTRLALTLRLGLTDTPDLGMGFEREATLGLSVY